MKALKIVSILLEILRNFLCRYDILYIVENADWVIKTEGLNFQKYLQRQGLRMRLSTTHLGAYGRTLHFGSIATIFNHTRLKKISSSNRIFLTWYHVVPGDVRAAAIRLFLPRLEYLITSCETSKRDLISLGIPDSKIKIIPIPIDLEIFDYTKFSKQQTLEKYNLPNNKILIGSFQKDGDGWGEGLSPKVVKGPDILCDALQMLNEKKDIHILLSGPSRGYVKKRLEDANISYSHIYLQDPNQVVELYSALDFYVISSRVEGGPKALMECWAMKIPLVSTKVGMCIDYGIQNENIIFSENINSESLAEAIYQALNLKNIKQISECGFKNIHKLTYEEQSKNLLKLYQNVF